MPLFSSYAKQWKFIAEKFGFDEDLIDEIGTNNDTDEACLDECVKKWVTESHPSSEEVNSVLSQLGEDNWSRGKSTFYFLCTSYYMLMLFLL